MSESILSPNDPKRLPCPKCQNLGKDNEFQDDHMLVCDWCYFYAPLAVWKQFYGWTAFRKADTKRLHRMLSALRMLAVVFTDSWDRRVMEKIEEGAK